MNHLARLLFVSFVAFCATPFLSAQENLRRGSVDKVVTDYKTIGIPHYRSSITDLTGGSANDLDAIPTASSALLPGVVFKFTISGTEQTWVLTSATTAEDGVTYVRPDDYNASTNARVWVNITPAGGGGGGSGDITEVIAGAGLTDGGTTGSVTLNIGAGTGITVNANDIAVAYGTTAGTAAQGNDSRLSDSRAPTGSAGGDLTGTYPNPTITADAVALGTDTTGNYVATIADSGASEITVANSGSESAAVTLAIASSIARDSETTAAVAAHAAALVAVNASGVNTDGLVEWSQLVGMPAGFADGSDDGSGGSSGTLNTLKENGSQVGDSDIVTLDFLGADFDLTESPNQEVNIVIAAAIARDAEVAAAYQPLEATLTDVADGTIAEDLVNTANPWADNEVSDTITVGASGSVNDAAIPSGITRDTEIATMMTAASAASEANHVFVSGGASRAFVETPVEIDSSGNVTGIADITATGGLTASGGTFSVTNATDGATVATITETDADAASDTQLLRLVHNDGADANVIYLRMVGDADGTPSTDYDFTQSGFTSLLPVNVPAEAYDATGWNGDTGAPQKDAVRDQFEGLASVYQPLEATLTDIADGTIAENLVNTANPWADNEVADAITVTGDVSAGTLDASGFNGNLATTDNTVQEIAQKLDDLSTGGATNINDIGDATADGSVAQGAHEMDFTSTIDAAGESIWTLTNTDADAVNDNSFIDLRHNDGADANVFYMRMVGDNDGTPTNDFLFSQAGFTSTLPVNVPAEAYDATGWNGDTGAPQKDAVRDQFEALASVYQPLEATLTDIADGTIAEDLVNTANPWADNEVSDTLTLGASAVASTATAGDNDTSVATTAFVNTQTRGSNTGVHATPSTSNPLALSFDAIRHTVWYGATGEIDLPAAASYTGRGFTVYNTGAFTITFDPNASEVIVRDGNVQTGGVSMTLSSGAGNFVSFISDGARWITLGYKGVLAVGS